MPNFSDIPDILFFVVLAASLWPGVENARQVDKPKKGYWTISTVFWPLRKAYRDLWPHHAVLEKAAQRSHVLALLLTFLIMVLNRHVQAFARAFGPNWVMAELAVVAFLLGRTSGFWSADRRIIRAREADEAAEAKARGETS